MLIGELLVIDNDSGPFGDFKFSIENNPHLNISNNGSLVLKASFDREVSETFMARVFVTDTGGLSAQQDVHIEILDKNDNRPQFSRNTSVVFIDENELVLSSSPRIRVYDNDIGNNALLNLTSSYFDFTLDNVDEFALNLKLPFSLTRDSVCNGLEVTLRDEITATDNGSPALSTTSELIIIVTDVNDHYPDVNIETDDLVVKERAPINTVIANFETTDDDPCAPNNILRLELADTPFSEFFAIQNNSQLIVANENIGLGSDDLVDQVLELLVVVTDRGIPALSRTVQVNVKVEDSNDELPSFVDFMAETFIDENSPIGYKVASFGQADIDRNSNLSQSIECVCLKDAKPVLPCTLIDLDRSSFPKFSIQVVDLIDYETVSDVNCEFSIADENGIQLQVVTQSHKFQIRNMNDNEPVFDHNEYSFTLSEDTLTGTLIGRVEASDADGELNQIWFTVNSSLLRIDEQSGDIFLAERLDYEIGFFFY